MPWSRRTAFFCKFHCHLEFEHHRDQAFLNVTAWICHNVNACCRHAVTRDWNGGASHFKFYSIHTQWKTCFSERVAEPGRSTTFFRFSRVPTPGFTLMHTGYYRRVVLSQQSIGFSTGRLTWSDFPVLQISSIFLPCAKIWFSPVTVKSFFRFLVNKTREVNDPDQSHGPRLPDPVSLKQIAYCDNWPVCLWSAASSAGFKLMSGRKQGRILTMQASAVQSQVRGRNQEPDIHRWIAFSPQGFRHVPSDQNCDPGNTRRDLGMTVQKAKWKCQRVLNTGCHAMTV
jgi:hypothetical protein